MAEDFFEPTLTQLRQGDIFQAIPFVRMELSQGTDPELVPRLTPKPCRAMLLNQSCDIDKPTVTRLVVVSVVPLSVLSAGDQNNTRKNKVFSRLYLPDYRGVLGESFVFFLEPMTIERSYLASAPRMVSLSDRGRRALYTQYTRWISRWELAEIQCPGCGVTFNPASTLPVIND